MPEPKKRIRDVSDFAASVQRMHPSLRKCFAGDVKVITKIRRLAKAIGYPEKITDNCKVAEVCQKMWPYVLEYKK